MGDYQNSIKYGKCGIVPFVGQSSFVLIVERKYWVAKKFVWFFYTIFWKNTKELFGQPSVNRFLGFNIMCFRIQTSSLSLPFIYCYIFEALCRL